MQINTNYASYAQVGALPSLLAAIARLAPSTPSTSSSLFGPAATLSLGSGAAASAGGGYSHLGRVQFDSSAVLAAKYAAARKPAPSPKMQRQERATLGYAAGLVQRGRLDEARELLQQWREKNRASGPTVHALGVVELEQRNYEKAERLFRQAHYMAPERGYDQDADIARYLQKDDAEVLAVARRLVGAPRTHEQGTRLLIGLTQRNPVHTEARVLLADNLLKKRDAVNGLAQYRLAIVTADQDQLARIEERLSELVATAPQAAYVRRLLGQTQLRLGKHEQAAETLAKATELAGGDTIYRAAEAPAQIAIGRDKLASHDIVGAIASFERAQNLDFFSTEARVALGEAYVARGELRTRLGALSAAIGDFNIALGKLRDDGDDALRPRLARSAFAAGLMVESQHLASAENVGDESIAFKVAFDSDPDNTVYRSKWAEISNRAGDEFLVDEQYEDAAYAYQRAYNLYKANETYRANTINAFTLYGDEQMDLYGHDEAVAAYKTAYDIDHGDTLRLKLAAAYNARGLAYADEGKLSLARADFLEALRYDSDNQEYQDNYDSVAA